MECGGVIAYAECYRLQFNTTQECYTMVRSVSSASFLFILLMALPCNSFVAAEDVAVSRWEKDIVAIEKKIVDGTSAEHSSLFVGSSSIRMWNLAKSFPDLKAANHGFGGSVLSDSLQFFDRIVVPVKPSVIVLYAGDNDIAAGKSPETVHADFLSFAELMEKKIPDCKQLLYISIKPSTRRWAMAEKIQKTNSLIKASCDANPRLQFVDVWAPMLGPDGLPNAELLLLDGLHMTESGYKIWAEALQPHLMMP